MKQIRNPKFFDLIWPYKVHAKLEKIFDSIIFFECILILTKVKNKIELNEAK